MTPDGALTKSVHVDVFPARELDEVLHVLVDPRAFASEEGGDARRELVVERVDVEHELADGTKRLGTGHFLCNFETVGQRSLDRTQKKMKSTHLKVDALLAELGCKVGEGQDQLESRLVLSQRA